MSTPILGVRYWFDRAVSAYTAKGRPNLPIGTTPPVDNFVLGITRPSLVAGSDGFASCRVARGDLVVIDGDYIVTTAGARVAGLLVKGVLRIRAADVTVEDCIVEPLVAPTTTTHCIDTSHAAARNAKVRFCEVSGAAIVDLDINGIGPKSVDVYRSYIHDVIDGMSVFDTTGNEDPVSIRGSIIDRLFYITPDPNHSDNRSHNDCIQSQGGPATLLIEGNVLRGYDSPNSTNGGSATGYSISAVMLNTNASRRKTDVSVLRNWISGGGDSINGRGTDGGTVKVAGNRFARERQYYPLTTNITLSTVWVVPTTGTDANVWEDTGVALSSTATFASGSNTIRRYY